MKLQYLDDARRDVAWWRYHYRKTFPQGSKNAYRHLAACERVLKDNPRIGQVVEGGDLRKLSIPNTPFAIIYRVRNGLIEIMRVYDMRQNGSEGFQED
jgi:plasmid stabilization system protein ParE